MDYKVVADYGSEAHGHSLHTWDDGKRVLAKRKNCGGYLLIQYSEYYGASDDDYIFDIRDDSLLAAALLHDVVEDTGGYRGDSVQQ